MKMLKKTFALILCLAMVLGMATTVFATGDTKEYQYEIFQIFTGEFAGDVLTNVMWGKNGTGTEGTAVPQETLDALEALSSDEVAHADKLAVILPCANLTGEPFAEFNTDNIEDTIADQADGYYLIRDAAGTQDGGGESYTAYIVKVVDGSLEFERKANAPEVDKVIVEDTAEVKQNEASIGDTIEYKLVGTVPSNIDLYTTYYYEFTDTLSKGLTITDTRDEDGIQTDVEVMIGETPVTDKFAITAAVQADGTTKLTITCANIKALEGVTIDANTEVVVTYTAVLNKDAEIVNGNENIVQLTYSNNPNVGGEGSEGTTPEQEVTTYTTEIIINKVDQNNKVLTGAGFTLTGESVKTVLVTTNTYTEDEAGTFYKLKDGSYTEVAPTEGTSANYDDASKKYKCETKTEVVTKAENVSVTSEVGTDGKLIFTGLGAGTYTITESTVPAGYNEVKPITVTIAGAVDENGAFDWTYQWDNDENNNTNTVTVKNQKGATLPETGGIGTTIFYALGGVLVLAAIVLLITKKRMNTAK